MKGDVVEGGFGIRVSRSSSAEALVSGTGGEAATEGLEGVTRCIVSIRSTKRVTVSPAPGTSAGEEAGRDSSANGMSSVEPLVPSAPSPLGRAGIGAGAGVVTGGSEVVMGGAGSAALPAPLPRIAGRVMRLVRADDSSEGA